jgi:hypothetical protein
MFYCGAGIPRKNIWFQVRFDQRLPELQTQCARVRRLLYFPNWETTTPTFPRWSHELNIAMQRKLYKIQAFGFVPPRDSCHFVSRFSWQKGAMSWSHFTVRLPLLYSPRRAHQGIKDDAANTVEIWILERWPAKTDLIHSLHM